MSRSTFGKYLAEGFTDDCEELIHRCSRVDILSYKTFTEIFKDMKICALYRDRVSCAELAELSEEVLHIAKHYMCVPTILFEASVAGLFLVYALLKLQPLEGFAALRLMPDDVLALTRIEAVARREHRTEVLFILAEVLISGPCKFCVTPRERSWDQGIKKYYDSAFVDKSGAVRPKGVLRRQSEELDLLRELRTLQRRYTDAKGKITGGSTDRNLNYSDPKMAESMEASLKALVTGNIDEASPSSLDEIDAAQSIKRRAMRTVVNPVGHLSGVQERAKKPSTSNGTFLANKRPVKPRRSQDYTTFLIPRSPRKAAIPKKARLANKNTTVESQSNGMNVEPCEATEDSNVIDLCGPNMMTEACQTKDNRNDTRSRPEMPCPKRTYGNKNIHARTFPNATQIMPSQREIVTWASLKKQARRTRENTKKEAKSTTILLVGSQNQARTNNNPAKKPQLSPQNQVWKKNPVVKTTATSRKRKVSTRKSTRNKRRMSCVSSSESDSDSHFSLVDTDEEEYSVTDDMEFDKLSEMEFEVTGQDPGNDKVSKKHDNELLALKEDSNPYTPPVTRNRLKCAPGTGSDEQNQDSRTKTLAKDAKSYRPSAVQAKNGNEDTKTEVADKTKGDTSPVGKKSKAKSKKDNKREKQNISPRRSPRNIRNTSETSVRSSSDEEKPVLRRWQRPERRDMKKSKVKSCFKRMGILPIANFNDDDNPLGFKN